jgi:hypothetical protein
MVLFHLRCFVDELAVVTPTHLASVICEIRAICG